MLTLSIIPNLAWFYLFLNKEIYNIKTTKFKSLILNFNLLFLKYSRPFLPPFFRLIPPARWAKQRMSRNPNLKFSEKANI